MTILSVLPITVEIQIHILIHIKFDHKFQYFTTVYHLLFKYN